MCRLTSTLCGILHLMGEVSRSPLIFVMLEVMWWVPLSQEDGSPQNKWKKLMPAAHCSDNVYALCTVPTNQSIRRLNVAKSCVLYLYFIKWKKCSALEAVDKSWLHQFCLTDYRMNPHVHPADPPSPTCLMGSLSSCQVREGASPSGG